MSSRDNSEHSNGPFVGHRHRGLAMIVIPSLPKYPESTTIEVRGSIFAPVFFAVSGGQGNPTLGRPVEGSYLTPLKARNSNVTYSIEECACMKSEHAKMKQQMNNDETRDE